MSYAWIIDTDKTEDDPATSAVGVIGPSAAPDWMVSALSSKQFHEVIRHTDPPFQMYNFYIYDDDKELYYIGRMITDEGQSEEACYGPLGDWGAPAAGASEIRYRGHPEMDCG